MTLLDNIVVAEVVALKWLRDLWSGSLRTVTHSKTAHSQHNIILYHGCNILTNQIAA